MAGVSKLHQALDLDETYISLARNHSLWKLDHEEFLRAVCKYIATALKVERTGIHLLDRERKALKQKIHFSLSTDRFSNGLILKKSSYPAYFKSLNALRFIDAHNATRDVRTRELSKAYLAPHYITAKLDCSLHHAGTLIGALYVEHVEKKHEWKQSEISFLNSVSDLVSHRLLRDKHRLKNNYYSDMNAFDRAVINNSNNCIIALDANGKIKTINQATCDLLDYTSNELLGTDFYRSIIVTTAESGPAKNTGINIDDSAIYDVSTLRQNIREGKTSSGDGYFKHHNGSAIPVNITFSTIKGRDDQLKGYVCTAVDLTERLNTEKALFEKSDHYRFVFEASDDSIFLMRNDVFTDCNPATLKIFGCTREQIINETPYRFSPLLQPDGRSSKEKALEKIASALQGKTELFEWLHCRYDGSIFDAEVKLNKVALDDESYILASVRDISERKISENALNESRQKIMEHNESLALINTLSNQLHATDSISEIYDRTLQALEWVPHSPRVSVYTVDEEAQVLNFVSGLGHEPEVLEQFKTIPINPKFNLIPLETGELIYSPDISTDERLLPLIKEKMLATGIHSIVEIPLVYKEEKIAVAVLAYEISAPLSPENLEVLYSIGKTVSLAIVNARTRSELGHIAHHDSLTGLTNRAHFHKQFKSTVLKGGYENATLFLLDLDRFKEINDTLGHFTGDKILQQIGPRLQSVIHGHEFIVSRLGGDEFIVLVYGIDQSHTAEKFARNIIKCLQEPYPIDDLNLEIDTSMGIAMYPKDGMDSHALLRSADVAMYQAKQKSLGFAFYQQDTDIHTPERLAMIAEMGGSITSGQLFLHYQPKLNLQTDEITGFEALARWDHPRLGLLGPSMFVPLIEMSNSIFQLTEEVLHQALAQQMQWRKEGYHYSVAVNLSARNLIDDRIIGLLESMLDYYDTPAGMLELEITETALMHDAYRATDYLKQLSDLGIQLSIDDFGTGYSSLSYLQNLPIHKLKLDREFIMNMLDNEQGVSVVKTIISLANTLDLQVIAEGVEDENTLVQLKNLNCDEAQGFHICYPDAWKNIQHWLRRKGKI